MHPEGKRSFIKPTNCTYQNPSWDTNRSSGSQDIPHILWYAEFITTFTKVHHLSLP